MTLYFAQRTNYQNYDFTNEKWEDVSWDEIKNKIIKYGGINEWNNTEKRLKLNPHEVVQAYGGLLLQYEPNE